MAKKIIKLTESEFRNLVGDSVHDVLTRIGDNTALNGEGIDISQIDIETLRQAYRDLRLTPVPVTYDDNLSFPIQIKEACGDILPPDSVVNKIIQKYKLSTSLVNKVEAKHKISIYIIVALIGENVKLIKTDMEKMGYFLGHTGNVYNIQGMKFIQLQFEPYCQLQDDETDNIKSKYSTLYHWTPEYNINEIMLHGLVPSHRNNMFNYPPRTYLMKGDCDDNEMIGLGQKLCLFNRNPNNNGPYVLLAINIKDIDDDIRFYFDPNSAIGIYTEQVIPNDKIQQINKQVFSTRLK